MLGQRTENGLNHRGRWGLGALAKDHLKISQKSMDVFKVYEMDGRELFLIPTAFKWNRSFFCSVKHTDLFKYTNVELEQSLGFKLKTDEMIAPEINAEE